MDAQLRTPANRPGTSGRPLASAAGWMAVIGLLAAGLGCATDAHRRRPAPENPCVDASLMEPEKGGQLEVSGGDGACGLGEVYTIGVSGPHEVRVHVQVRYPPDVEQPQLEFAPLDSDQWRREPHSTSGFNAHGTDAGRVRVAFEGAILRAPVRVRIVHRAHADDEAAHQ